MDKMLHEKPCFWSNVTGKDTVQPLHPFYITGYCHLLLNNEEIGLLVQLLRAATKQSYCAGPSDVSVAIYMYALSYNILPS